MGADLYIRSINDRFNAEFQPRLDEAVAVRDKVYPLGSVPQDCPEQKRVRAIYDEMYDRSIEEVGYLRDSYNSSSVFNYLGHSWWALCKGKEHCFSTRAIIDRKGFISPENAALIADRCSVEPMPVEDYLKKRYAETVEMATKYNWKLPSPLRLTPEIIQENTLYYRAGQMRLVQFFRLAAELGEPIRASV